VNEQVEHVLVDVLQVPASTIKDELAMTDLEVWDSLKHMELIASLEQIFALELTFDEIVRMRSVGEIKRVLKERGAAA
jgi:acyl carrier protein